LSFAAADLTPLVSFLFTNRNRAESSIGRGRVLIVDDNPVNKLVAQRAVDRFGYAAEVVSGGQEALSAIREAGRRHAPFDAVLLDCQMPDMNGCQATAAIRDWENGNRRVPIIALTANCVEGDCEKCLDSGMDDYIAKPFSRGAREYSRAVDR
jgi:CheY-like chemotaxis protein